MNWRDGWYVHAGERPIVGPFPNRDEAMRKMGHPKIRHLATHVEYFSVNGEGEV